MYKETLYDRRCGWTFGSPSMFVTLSLWFLPVTNETDDVMNTRRTSLPTPLRFLLDLSPYSTLPRTIPPL